MLNDEQLVNFYRKVDKAGPDGCWEWTGSKINNGYSSGFYTQRFIAKLYGVSFQLVNFIVNRKIWAHV